MQQVLHAVPAYLGYVIIGLAAPTAGVALYFALAMVVGRSPRFDGLCSGSDDGRITFAVGLRPCLVEPEAHRVDRTANTETQDDEHR